ncbi:MAG: YfcC family protein, partial [Raoultibacter sp.]
WTDSEVGGELAFMGDVKGEVVTEEAVSDGWSAFLTGLPLGQWYFDEASTWFLIMAIIIGVVGGVSESRFVKAFINGTADMMSVVMIIALARSITVLMGETGLDQWILTNAANFLSGVSAIIFAPLSYLLYLVLSFLIPSSSGMATVSMPIMGPLASQLGFSVETMVMIFSAGNGLINLFAPTCGAIMGGLAIAKIEYTTWLKFSMKIIVTIGIVSVIILTAAMLIL